MKKRSVRQKKMPTANELARQEIRRNGYTRKNGGKQEQLRGTSRPTSHA